MIYLLILIPHFVIENRNLWEGTNDENSGIHPTIELLKFLWGDARIVCPDNLTLVHVLVLMCPVPASFELEDNLSVFINIRVSGVIAFLVLLRNFLAKLKVESDFLNVRILAESVSVVNIEDTSEVKLIVEVVDTTSWNQLHTRNVLSNVECLEHW